MRTAGMFNSAIVVISASLFCAGCGLDSAPGHAARLDGEQTTISSVETDPTCPDWGCGTNSATVGDGVVFDELDGSGLDTGAVRITRATRYGQAVELHVVRHSLFAVATDGSESVYTYSQLNDTLIELTGTTSNGEVRSYELRIDSVSDRHRFWSGKSDVVPSYRISSRPKDNNTGIRMPICKVSLPPGEVPSGSEHDAIVFEGDHYDAGAKTVTDSSSTTRFRLACVGTAPAKLHLMRHTRAGGWTQNEEVEPGGLPSFYTPVASRQAMLKMFTADYCGTGRSFTVDGRPLKYGDKNRWYPGTPTLLSQGELLPGDGVLEALWDENGALCLEEPRLAFPPSTQTTPPIEPVSRPDVEQECAGRHDLPRCTGPAGLLSSGTEVVWHVISALP